MGYIMAFNVDLREKNYICSERGKSKSEVAEILELGVASLYRWLKKNAEMKA
jgi:transposase